MPVIGYGEDGLTYRAVTQSLGVLLSALNDSTDPSRCLVFYRPSFGRSGGIDSPQFGEFDSIVVTDKRIFLVESKWDGSPVVLDGNVFLEARQILRHRIFRWLAERWPTPHPTWREFRAAREPEFRAAFGNRPLAPEGSVLARNLEYVLNKVVSDPNKEIKDVVLFFHRGIAAPPTGVIAEANGFDLVPFPFETLEGSGFFEMG